MATSQPGDPNPQGERNEDTSPQNRSTKDDDLDHSRRMAAYWKKEIEESEEDTKRWFTCGETIIKRYRDERDRATEEGQRRVNALWTWYCIIKPAIYGRCPQAVAERRFLDRDPVGRMSAMMLERALRYELSTNGFHEAMKRAVQDYLLPGRGQLWVRYEPTFGEIGETLPAKATVDMRDSEGPLEDDEEDISEELERESAPVDYVHWKDFRVLPKHARNWYEVQSVAKRIYSSQRECKEFFGEKIGKEIKADSTLSVAERMSGSSTAIFTDINERRRVIWEIWNKPDRTVYWVSTGFDYLCKVEDDPLELEGFFPCPEPLSAVMTNDTMIPVPFYMEWQDQAIQLDELTQRISMLSKACKVAGTYDASNRALRRLMDESVENELIPVDNWAMHKEKGGIEGGISFMPLQEVIETMKTLIEVREKVFEDSDRVTGVSDILRGVSDARETLGAQRLKTNAAGTRVDDQRTDVGRFAGDVVRIVAEVICKHFQSKTIIQSSGILQEEGLGDLMTEAA
jgi:hypothetical protein